MNKFRFLCKWRWNTEQIYNGQSWQNFKN